MFYIYLNLWSVLQMINQMQRRAHGRPAVIFWTPASSSGNYEMAVQAGFALLQGFFVNSSCDYEQIVLLLDHFLFAISKNTYLRLV